MIGSGPVWTSSLYRSELGLLSVSWSTRSLERLTDGLHTIRSPNRRDSSLNTTGDLDTPRPTPPS